MSRTYFNMTTKELLTLRSKKFNRLVHLRGKRMGYFEQQEARKLDVQLYWIDNILNLRKMQFHLI